jgi:hypothetical protein
MVLRDQYIAMPTPGFPNESDFIRVRILPDTPTVPAPRGTPFLWNDRGVGSWTDGTLGVPHPIAILGDDLSLVSDVNVCRKMGYTPTLRYLGGGTTSGPMPGRWGYPHPSKSPGQAPPTQKDQWGVGSLAHETQWVPPPDRHFGRYLMFSLRRKSVLENGRGVPLWVPWRGYPIRTNVGR